MRHRTDARRDRERRKPFELALIFVDSNVPMYVVGATHPNQNRARALLADLFRARERLVTDAEVFQEILHRYVSLRRHEMIPAAFKALLSFVDEVMDVKLEDVEAARQLLSPESPLSARDAVHVAVMRRCGVSKILSFDKGFEGIEGIELTS